MEPIKPEQMDQRSIAAIDAGRYLTEKLHIVNDYQLSNIKNNGVAVLEVPFEMVFDFNNSILDFRLKKPAIVSEEKLDYLGRVAKFILGPKWVTNVKAVERKKPKQKRKSPGKPNRRGKRGLR